MLFRSQYSKDLKERVVYQWFTLGKDTAEIAENLNMSKRVVQWVLLLWEEIGDVRGEGSPEEFEMGMGLCS